MRARGEDKRRDASSCTGSVEAGGVGGGWKARLGERGCTYPRELGALVHALA